MKKNYKQIFQSMLERIKKFIQKKPSGDLPPDIPSKTNGISIER